MNEEIVKSEEAIKATASKTEQILQQIRAGEGGSVWRELWNTYQGSLIHIGKILLLAILVLIIAYFICKMLRGIMGKLGAKYSIDISIAGIINRTLTVIIYCFAALIILDLLGINTASVLTVLGAAGLAVGLALKDTLSNIAAGIFLLTQHPYKTGDFVECAGMSGSILTIGLFTTKLRTPQGQDIFVPNNSIITSPITNYSSNKTRRADITVGISYGDNLEEGIKVLQQLLESNPIILKDPAPAIYVSELADSSVNLTLRYWTDSDKYWDAYWEVKRALKGTIEGAGLNIPFPQRVITMANKQ
ncbi:MAG: mechanosensitive ion channel family protein [Victivallales bacterium]|nr:mechanosensitive ion channel family protein [Victivallales bacterium]